MIDAARPDGNEPEYEYRQTRNEAAERLPQTKHGRYVLDISRSWHWAAFDVNDILQIEGEASRATVERIRTQIHGQVGERLAGQKHVGLLIVDRILDEEAAR